MNKQLEKAIKRLSEINEEIEEYDGNILKQDIETVLKELKRLQEKTIEKDKIREKIEECIKNIERDERHDEWGYERCKIQVLQELLEGK